MIYQCSEIPVQFWIKLQKVQTQSYPSLERLKRSLESQNEQSNAQMSQNIKNLNPESSLYISPIFSLQRVAKNKYNSHIHNQKRLLYHNYIKYKTIPFSYNHIFMPKEYSSSLIQQLTNSIYTTVIQKKNNFCFLGFGSKNAETQNLIEGRQGATEGVYYSALIKLFDMVKNFNESTKFHDSTSLTCNINFLAVTETKIIDLLNINNEIYVSQNPKTLFSEPLIFQNATECCFTSSYELYTTFKKVIFRRKELTSWSTFVIKVNFYCSGTQKNKKIMNHALLIEWVKETKNFISLDNSRSHQRNKSSFGEKSLLCLNQCILQMYKKVQIRNNKKAKNEIQLRQETMNDCYNEQEISGLSNLQSFRNSLITRMLKPYLLFNSQFVVMTLCSINEQHQNDSYQTLMLGKHLSKLKSLLVLNQIPPVLTHKESKDSSLRSHQGQSSIDQNDQNHIAQNFQTIESQNQHQSKKIPLNKPKSYYESSLNSPTKKSKTVKQSSSHHELLSHQSLNKQKKVRQKLLSLLQESKQKKQIQNGDKQSFNQISKQFLSEKQKCLKTKKQLNILKIKANTKNLKAKIIQKVQSQTEILEQQIKRLNFDEKKLQKELHDLKGTIQGKIYCINTLNKDKNSSFGKPSIEKQKQKLQKMKLLKSHLKNELEITEMQINQFLEEKESIKSIYVHQINQISHHEKQVIKKIQIERNNSLVENLNKSRQNKPLPKVRLSQQMQPFYKNSLRSKVPASLTISQDQITDAYTKQKQNSRQNRYNTEFNQKSYQLEKTLSKKNKQPIECLDAIELQKIKQQRLLIRKRLHLNEKINKGKGEYIKFLQETANRYLNYNPKQRQSTK